MTIILFLVDTSASMNQRIYLGARPTLLDVAKDAVEKFIKIRQRDSASRGDRYMLLTYEDPPSNIKAGWKENHATFMTELKNLQALGMTTMGSALKNAFDLLNINRMQTGIDTYGQGRSPFYLEPSIILLITDGGKLSATNGLQEEFSLTMHSSIPGAELTKELYRWDQRMFALILRLSGTPPIEREQTFEKNFIDDLCEATGGRTYSVTSQRSLMQSLESLVVKIQAGVVIYFEKVGPDPPPINPEEGSEETKPPNGTIPNSFPNQSWHNCRKLIYVQRSAQKGYSYGYWPIPEGFWPDLNSPALPPRTAHPNVKFTCANQDPMVIDNLPFDKYELEPSPLTQYILSRKQPTVAWQVFVANSHKNSDLGLPFGYLKASTSLTCVNLFVMPYNYPILLPLLDDLFKVHRCKPTREWKQQFDNYLKNMPLYYAGPLKRALQRMGAPNTLVPDNMENCLNYSVLNYLKRLKNQAKAEYEKLINSVGTGKSLVPEGIRVVASRSPKLSEMSLVSNPSLSERFSVHKAELNDFNGFMLGVQDKDVKTESFRNAFDILRVNLLDQIARMRANFLQTSISHTRIQHEDQLHSLPVSQMGNYQEYLKRMPTPLREIESTPVRQHMFGNPFKIEKQMMVDEADIDLVGSGGGASPGRGMKRPNEAPGSPRHKRKPGPLPKDFRVWKPRLQPSPTYSPALTPPSSPMPPPMESPPPSPSAIYSSFNGPLLTTETKEPVPSPPSPPAITHNQHLDNESRLLPVITNHVNETKPPVIMVNHVHQNGMKDSAFITTIKTSLFKEVRRPGKNFKKLFEQLESISGSLSTQILVVRDVITEASRFKRTSLIRLLEEFEQRIMVESESRPLPQNNSTANSR